MDFFIGVGAVGLLLYANATDAESEAAVARSISAGVNHWTALGMVLDALDDLRDEGGNWSDE